MFDGGPAFPVSTRPCVTEDGHGHQDSESAWQFSGMTLRDWFAGQALVGLLYLLKDQQIEDYATATTAEAYRLADAMLRAREAR